ncbi:hypothetical protein QC763_0094770 [Podospora pseudopauciseta]|uniref:Uncharacterized protein n=1 Tax=Podospora pseudopauciseta TaxID=2093780 RepID=A0ABR0H5E1_9PEZI|nr:hypothetical protein QC763_0094770 [Podospora pseudopauciseta]
MAIGTTDPTSQRLTSSRSTDISEHWHLHLNINHKFETQEKHKAFTVPLVVNRFLAAGSESASTVWERLLDKEDACTRARHRRDQVKR